MEQTVKSPQLHGVAEDETHAFGKLMIRDFHFESGAVLPEVSIHFETWGTLNSAKSNAVVVCHALTGNANAGGGAQSAGWWSNLIGPGCAIDTKRDFVICSNVLGGCDGSSGPSSLNSSGQPYALAFPITSVRDMVMAQMELLKALDIQSVQLVIGGSLGGMQAWEWAICAPDCVRHAIVIAAQPAFPPLAIGYNEAMRQAILADAEWHNGNYYAHATAPRAGLAAARAIGMLTYRTHELYNQRFARREPQGPTGLRDLGLVTTRYEVQSYLQHHGETLHARFDANSYLYLLRAMDDHDVGRGRGGVPSALSRIRSKLTMVGIPRDYLYDPEDLEASAKLARKCGVDCDFELLNSIHGHDAFLIEQQALGQIVKRARGGGEK